MMDVSSQLAELPARFTAVMLEEPDAGVDAVLAEAEADTGLFSDLAGAALAKARWLERIRILANEALDLVSEADGSAHERRDHMARLLSEASAK